MIFKFQVQQWVSGQPAKLSRLAIASVGAVLSVGFWLPAFAAPQNPIESSQAAQKLNEMFSQEIQQVLNSCANEGSVNLGAGPDRDGSVVCGDGTRNSTTQFNDYVATVSDFLSASFLIGVQAALKAYPDFKPEMVAMFANDPQGRASLEEALTSAITSSGMVPKDSPKSVSFLTDKVLERSLPILKNPAVFSNLLGNSQQYAQVASKFCTAPGMSVAQAKTVFPGLNSVQLYAICIQESGLASEIEQTVQPGQ